MLERLTKCTARVQQSVWWPGAWCCLLTTLVAQNEAIDANNLTSKTLALSYGRYHSVGRRRAVQTTKQMLRKNQDTWRALLAYRLTPLSNGISLQKSGL
ncbi:uncharacterized protein DAT39_022462 [Clarias magur]|uniref:Uncharacterized protein n=1 Tax=Clarias magur TaxID=1594786 RepID=A0A8J4TBE2_CLAMG|nr:uncharacterized protein DAT39_022462 [Clarias magur]